MQYINTTHNPNSIHTVRFLTHVLCKPTHFLSLIHVQLSLNKFQYERLPDKLPHGAQIGSTF